MSERTLLSETFENQRVEVTTSRAIVGATTYAVKNITSVAAVRLPPKRSGAVLLVLLGVLAGVVASGSALEGHALEPGPLHIVAGILVALGVALLVLSRPRFVVRIHTAGVEQQMLASSDEALVARVVAALNRAIVGD